MPTDFESIFVSVSTWNKELCNKRKDYNFTGPYSRTVWFWWAKKKFVSASAVISFLRLLIAF